MSLRQSYQLRARVPSVGSTATRGKNLQFSSRIVSDPFCALQASPVSVEELRNISVSVGPPTSLAHIDQIDPAVLLAGRIGVPGQSRRRIDSLAIGRRRKGVLPPIAFGAAGTGALNHSVPGRPGPR